MTYPLKSVRRKLLVLWLIGGALIFVIVFTMAQGTLSDQPGTIWEWFGSNMGLTLATMFGYVAKDSLDAGKPSPLIDGFFYRLMATLSVFYLLLMVATLVIWPAIPGGDLVTVLNSSKWWLGSVGSLVTIGINTIYPKSAADGPKDAKTPGEATGS